MKRSIVGAGVAPSSAYIYRFQPPPQARTPPSSSRETNSIERLDAQFDETRAALVEKLV